MTLFATDSDGKIVALGHKAKNHSITTMPSDKLMGKDGMPLSFDASAGMLRVYTYFYFHENGGTGISEALEMFNKKMANTEPAQILFDSMLNKQASIVVFEFPWGDKQTNSMLTYLYRYKWFMTQYFNENTYFTTVVTDESGHICFVE
jgi:hypothetical protein